MICKTTKWIRLNLCLAILLLGQIGISQEKLVSGSIKDQAGQPLAGVNIIIVGTSNGTQSTIEGTYAIKVEEGQTLRISFVGFISQNIVVNAQNTIDLVLLEDITALEEVVITALGMLREKKSLGYATQEVNGDAVSTVKSQNFINSFQEK